jgi:hypothetical protein
MPGYGPAVVGRMNRRAGEGRWWLRMESRVGGKVYVVRWRTVVGRTRGCGVGNLLVHAAAEAFIRHVKRSECPGRMRPGLRKLEFGLRGAFRDCFIEKLLHLAVGIPGEFGLLPA